MRIEIQLSDVIDEISMGPFGSDIKVDNFVEYGVPVLNGSNLIGYKLNDISFNYVSLEKAKTFRKAIAKRGDIVITHRGTLGQIAYIPEDSKYDKYVISQSQFRVKFNTSKIDPKYLVYLFHTPYGRKKLLSFKNHVGVPALAQATTNFRALNILIHDLVNQQKIASVITAIQNKIELNNRINAELEQMAKTIYDYWFVQFDFPISAEYAISIGQPELEGKPYKSSGGRMVWSGELKREVPEGWEVKSLGDVVEIKYGKDHKDVGIGLIPVYGSGGIMRFGDRAIYEKESILIPRKGTLSNLFYLDKPFWSVDTMFYTKMKVLKSGKYLFYTLERMKLASLNVGTAVPSLTTEVLNKLNTLFPSCDIISRFDDILIPTFAHKTRNIIENQKLTELRDWLLPMLMNGQVKVGVVEEEIHDIFYN
jgi:type I restriction enzyme, S subunit